MNYKRIPTVQQPTARSFSRWIRPHMRKYYLGCCDCSLVHEVQFRIVGVRKPHVQFRARRAIGYTKAQRARVK